MRRHGNLMLERRAYGCLLYTSNSGLDEMEKKGFLVVKPRIGTFVADYRKYGTADTLVSIMQYNGGMPVSYTHLDVYKRQPHIPRP